MRKYIAECLGTCALVFCGTGAIVINEISGGAISTPGIGMTFGLIVMVMIYALGDISGAHFNPAVSIGFWLAKRMSFKEASAYIGAQLIGALIASLLVRTLFPQNEMLGSTLPSGSASQSFLLEIILTFFLMLTIINVATGAKEKGITAALAIGGMVGLEAIFAGPVSGASMNPARSLAPALISGHLHDLWIYLIAPVIGSALSIMMHKLLEIKNSTTEN